MTTLDWRPLADALAAQLAATGELRDQAWRRAFEQIPRHHFVPRFLDLEGNGELPVDGYYKIIEAIMAAAQAETSEAPDTAIRSVPETGR